MNKRYCKKYLIDCPKLNRPVEIVAIFEEYPLARQSPGSKIVGMEPIACGYADSCEHRDIDGNCPLFWKIPR